MGNDQKRIVITEIPYDTLKSKTVEKMEQLRIDGKVPDVLEVRDESGRDGLRIAVDLKKGANQEAIINYFYRLSVWISDFKAAAFFVSRQRRQYASNVTSAVVPRNSSGEHKRNGGTVFGKHGLFFRPGWREYHRTLQFN